MTLMVFFTWTVMKNYHILSANYLVIKLFSTWFVRIVKLASKLSIVAISWKTSKITLKVLPVRCCILYYLSKPKKLSSLRWSFLEILRFKNSPKPMGSGVACFHDISWLNLTASNVWPEFHVTLFVFVCHIDITQIIGINLVSLERY